MKLCPLCWRTDWFGYLLYVANIEAESKGRGREELKLSDGGGLNIKEEVSAKYRDGNNSIAVMGFCVVICYHLKVT